FFLSQTGECFHNLTVTGGKQRAEGPLSMKRELREVLRMLAELERAMQAAEMRVLTLGREIKELTSLLDRLENDKREADKQAMTSGHLLQQLESEMAKVRERIEISEKEVARLAVERTAQQESIRVCELDVAAAEDNCAQLEQSAAFAREQLGTLRERRDASANAASQSLARVASLEERHRAAAAVVERIESLVAEMSQRLESLRAQIDWFGSERQQRQKENADIATRLLDLEAERNASDARDGLLQAESEQVRARLTEIDAGLQSAREQLDSARDRRGDLSASAAKVQSDMQYMD